MEMEQNSSRAIEEQPKFFASDKDKARFLAIQRPELPESSIGTLLGNNAFRISIGLRLTAVEPLRFTDRQPRSLPARVLESQEC